MSKLEDIYNFDNEKFSVLREPSREVIKAYQNANRFFDTTQEYVYIKQNMPYLARAIHNQAHEFPKLFDKFIDMLHERHLMGEYPETPELNWKEELTDIDSVFALILRIFESIQEALEQFRKVVDTADFRPMSLLTEELMTVNSQSYTKYLLAWGRWGEDGGSKTSFDSWCQKHFELNC